MTIKQQGGIFGRNPSFNDVEVKSIGIGTPAPTNVDLEIKSSVPRFQLTDSDNSAYTQFLFNTGSFAVDVDPTASGGSSKFTVDVDNVRQLELNSSGNLIVETGNLVIGTSGKGIDFSATSGTGTSELFDDYEEGSWSPVVRDASSAGNTGGGTVTGNYTKTGRTVFINFAVSNLDTTGMTSGNDLFITGLPYAVASISGTCYFTGALVMHSVTTSGNQVAAIQDNQDYAKLYEVVSGAAFDFITVGDITSGVADIRFSLTYEAA